MVPPAGPARIGAPAAGTHPPPARPAPATAALYKECRRPFVGSPPETVDTYRETVYYFTIGRANRPASNPGATP